nr:PREDICTED: uncharacterized protein LOC105663414 [Megachile rotundata]
MYSIYRFLVFGTYSSVVIFSAVLEGLCRIRLSNLGDVENFSIREFWDLLQFENLHLEIERAQQFVLSQVERSKVRILESQQDLVLFLNSQTQTARRSDQLGIYRTLVNKFRKILVVKGTSLPRVGNKGISSQETRFRFFVRSENRAS